MKQTQRARLHRFRDSVAVSLGADVPTFYLSADLAEKLGEELRRYSAEIAEGVPFSASKVGTTVVGSTDPADVGEVEP